MVFQNNSFEDNATTTKTRKHIKEALHNRIVNTYGVDDKSLEEAILKMQGFNDAGFDYIKNVEGFFLNSINSIDANANKTDSCVQRCIAEADNVLHKTIGHDLLYRQMKEDFGKAEAQRITGMLYDYSIAVNDATKLANIYCYSYSGTNLVLNGRDGALKCAPAKHLHSYISMLAGTIHVLSNNTLAGAVAAGTIFIDSARILLNDNYSLDKIKNDPVARKYIENMFQQFIYDVNDCSRNTYESPFTNVSVFDRPKLQSIVEDYAWYFEGFDQDYVVDTILELQDIFCDLIDIGDPITKGPFTFPVCTVNLSKENGKVLDTVFLEKFCKRVVHRYNILVSKGTRCAACCRLLSDAELLTQAGSVNSFGSGLSLGSHRVCIINFPRLALLAETEEDFMQLLESYVKDAAKVLRSHKNLMIRLEKAGLQPHITDGTINMNRLFSTFGVLGTFECFKTLEEKFGVDEDRDIRIMSFFNEKMKTIGLELGLIPNCEQVPGETMASRLCNADKLIFGDKVKYDIYSNQTVPLTEHVDVIERLRRDGRINLLLTGGGIVHLTINERITEAQFKKVIERAVHYGCEHFAFNLFHSKCSNEHVSEGKYDVCPVCGEKIVDYGLRIIGYFRWSSGWTEPRQKELKDRYIVKI